MRYIPHTEHEIAAVLTGVRADGAERLLAPIREAMGQRAGSELPRGPAGTEAIGRLTALAQMNRTAPDTVAFLGAGAYAHFSPVVVDQIIQRAEFATAYTPYQPEVSQGTLQAIFEFQSLVATLL